MIKKILSLSMINTSQLQKLKENIIINKNDSLVSNIHICYDWAQSVVAPYSVGLIYFKPPFLIHLFCVCKTDEGDNYQLKFTIGKDELPKDVPKGELTRP